MATFNAVEQLILSQKETNSTIEIHDGNLLEEISTGTGKKFTITDTGSGFDVLVEDGNINSPSFELIFDRGFVDVEANIQKEGSADIFTLSIIGTDDVRDGLFGPENNFFLINMQDSPVYIKTEGDKIIIRKERIVTQNNNS